MTQSSGSISSAPRSPREPRVPPSVAIVVPAYNEAEVVGAVVAELVSRYPEVWVVDDGSSDDTAGRARRAGAGVARHVLNRGQGAALQTGIRLALDGDAACIVTFDSDGQHRVEDLDALVEPILSGEADVALGTRFPAAAASIPPARRWLLRLATLFTRWVSGIPVTDAHNGLRAFSRAAAAGLDIQLDRSAHASEILDQVRRLRLRFVEVPVRVRYTDYSIGKGQRASSAFRIVVDYLVGRILG